MLHRPPVKRAAAVCRGNMLLLMMAVLEDIFPLDLCTPSTCHSADTSACISTTSWMQQSGVHRRQKASRLIVVPGELVALSSLAQHRCRSTAMPLRHLPGGQNGDIRCVAIGIGILLDG